MTEIKVLMTCMGNICRSPMAQGVLQHEADRLGAPISTDSAGTAGYHVGDRPDTRTLAVLRKHNIKLDTRARQLQKSDFTEFDIIVGMDESNMKNIEKVRPKNSTAKVALFGSYQDGKPIEDPYYGGDEGFDLTFEQCVRYSKALLADLGYTEK